MSAEIKMCGQEYWVVLKRYHMNRSNPQMKPTAVRDMGRVMMATTSSVVRGRCLSFINRHGQPGNSPNGGGPRYA